MERKATGFEQLEALVRAGTTPQRLARRCQVILLAWLGGLDYALLHGPEITTGKVAAEQIMGRCV